MAKNTKTCEVMQYMEYMGCDIDAVEQRIKEITNLKTYCLILHNKDILPDGNRKRPHFHAILTFKEGKTWESVAKALGVDVQYVNKIKTTTKTAQLYLVHKNNPEKYQYNPKEVRANFDYEALVEDAVVQVSVESVLERIGTEEIKPYNLCDYVDIKTYAKYKERFDRAFAYVQNKKRSVNRDMECVYIYGPSGTGKTTLAKHLASQRGFETYISSGGKNPLDNYLGQECIVLDDIRGSVFPLADFLKLTDNNTDSLVGCRYYNKSISYCKLIICTSVMSLKDLYSGVTDKEKEPLKQLYRRFRTVIRLDDEKMHFMQFEEDTETEKEVGRMKNPVAIMFNPKVAKETVLEFAKAFGISADDIDTVADDGFLPAPDGDFDEVFPNAN